MPALSRSQQQLIIGELAWAALDLYAAALAKADGSEIPRRAEDVPAPTEGPGALLPPPKEAPFRPASRSAR